MRIVLTTFGTLGDLMPYLALGQALHAKSHSVAVAASASLCDYVTGAGLEPIPCYPDLSPEEARLKCGAFNHWPHTDGKPALRFEDNWEKFDIDARIRDLLRACRDADLLIRNWNLAGERIVEEILGLRSIEAIVTPQRLWRHGGPTCLDDIECGRCDESKTKEGREHFRWHQLRRRSAGLPETPAGGWTDYFRGVTLLGASRYLLEHHETSAWAATLCGFWFYQAPEWQAWRPDPELAAFMDRSPRPIVLSFSSQPVADPARVVELHVAAARRIGRPILIQCGWAGLDGISDGDVLFRGFLPQDWLFARAACVIHHGGIGTLARALRHGCPMLVEPYGNDQYFNASLVLRNGIGTGVHPGKVRAPELVRLLKQKVLCEETARNAARLAECLNREDGIAVAVRAIESGR
jgi:UDP:flavonoid glycosyltransferase YjiC (YdhE family)